uniref:Uncharacterized protein n=1 Tax=Globodera rostochiensis TaxID=31243 RepID=A0A914HEJ3_GLORO
MIPILFGLLRAPNRAGTERAGAQSCAPNRARPIVRAQSCRAQSCAPNRGAPFLSAVGALWVKPSSRENPLYYLVFPFISNMFSSFGVLTHLF